MKIPNLFELIFKSRDTPPQLETARWQLFEWVLSFEHKFINTLKKQRNDFILPLATIKYLLQNQVITLGEADAIFLTEYFVRESKINKHQPRFDIPRNMKIDWLRTAHLYVKMYNWICKAMEVCGLYSQAVRKLYYFFSHWTIFQSIFVSSF